MTDHAIHDEIALIRARRLVRQQILGRRRSFNIWPILAICALVGLTFGSGLAWAVLSAPPFCH